MKKRRGSSRGSVKTLQVLRSRGAQSEGEINSSEMMEKRMRRQKPNRLHRLSKNLFEGTIRRVLGCKGQNEKRTKEACLVRPKIAEKGEVIFKTNEASKEGYLKKGTWLRAPYKEGQGSTP